MAGLPYHANLSSSGLQTLQTLLSISVFWHEININSCVSVIISWGPYSYCLSFSSTLKHEGYMPIASPSLSGSLRFDVGYFCKILRFLCPSLLPFPMKVEERLGIVSTSTYKLPRKISPTRAHAASDNLCPMPKFFLRGFFCCF